MNMLLKCKKENNNNNDDLSDHKRHDQITCILKSPLTVT